MKKVFMLFVAVLVLTAPEIQAFEPSWGVNIEIDAVDVTGAAVSTQTHQFFSPEWSPDGATLVFANPGYGLYQVGVTGGTPELVYPDPQINTFSDPCYTPDGTEITFSHPVFPQSIFERDGYQFTRQIIGTIDIETGEYHEIGFGRRAVWSSSGRYLLYTLRSHSKDPDGDAIVLLDTQTNTETTLLSLPPDLGNISPDNPSITNPVFLPDESGIIYSYYDGTVWQLYRMLLADGVPVEITGRDIDCKFASVHPDGHHAIAEGPGNTLVWVDLQTGDIVPLTPSMEGYYAQSPSISPDGRQVCFAYVDPSMTETQGGRHLRRDIHVLDLGDLAEGDTQTAVESTPAAFPTLAAYPNPFNPATTLSFTVPASGYAELSIFNVAGQKVRTLVAGEMTAGAHQAVWDGRNDQGMPLASGMFIAQVKTGGVVTSSRLTLVK